MRFSHLHGQPGATFHSLLSCRSPKTGASLYSTTHIPRNIYKSRTTFDEHMLLSQKSVKMHVRTPSSAILALAASGSLFQAVAAAPIPAAHPDSLFDKHQVAQRDHAASHTDNLNARSAFRRFGKRDVKMLRGKLKSYALRARNKNEDGGDDSKGADLIYLGLLTGGDKDDARQRR